MSDATPRTESLFWSALAIVSPEERARYLDQTCGGDRRLRGQVEELLAAYPKVGGFLEPPTTGAAAPAERCGYQRPGAVIGPYKLLRQIGEGGMGTVWMAEQARPVRRQVALKLIKLGMDSRQVVARFEAERQALALMDHPNIARVFDAGTTENGRPYFVMELVHGTPITRFCDENCLTPRERLGLFVGVCQAVQHAHQKGVIHRDLKPSNVLVTIYDGVPVPKVIDFGVAKATEQNLTEQALSTQAGTMVGTFEYMSPEQAGMSPHGVDTRSDIYSLGVLLYELLTGTTPLTHKRVREAPYPEVVRMILEEEPPTPSARLSDSGEALAAISANRRTEPAKLARLLRGELDWIVMKSLEKDRNRRYEAAAGFALDVRRYLTDEPVLACPPSAGYRLRKFVRRNKGAVAAASLVAVALVGGTLGTTVGLVKANRARESAEKRLAQIEKGIDLLGSIFADLDPLAEEKEGRPLRAILGDRLDQAAAELEGEAVGDPLVVAKLQDRLGQTCLGLGQADRAEALFTKAIATRRAYLAADDPLTLASRHNQALAYEAAGRRVEAISGFEQVHDARVKLLGADHLDTLSTLNELADAYLRSGKEALAIPLLEQVREGRVRQLRENHDDTLATLQSLARAYSMARKHPEAIALAEKVRDARVKKHGDAHPHAIDALANLASVYQAGYRMKEALALYEQAEKTIVPKLWPHHPQTLRILYNLAQMYRAYRRTPEAITRLELVRERQMMTRGGHHPATLDTLWNLAMAYVDDGKPEKALPLFEQAALGVERIGFAHGAADRIVHQLASCHEHLKQYGEAEAWRRKWLAVAKAKDGPDSVAYAGVFGLEGLGSNLLRQKKYADAEPILRESLPILQRNEPNVWETFRTQSRFGGALLALKQHAEAEPHLVQGYQGMKAREKGRGTRFYGASARDDLYEALERLVLLYEATNRPNEAARWQRELEALTKPERQSAGPKDK